MIGLDPHDGLYGRLLFQSGRFRRLAGYRHLRSTECVAEIAADRPRPWFHPYWPGRLVLGDPAARDAVIHSVQCCIPDATILPVGIDRLIPGTGYGAAPGRAVARERSDRGGFLVYDIDVVDEGGEICERWEGLRLRVVERREPGGDWPSPLLGPYLERRVRSLLPDATPMAMAVDRDVDVPRRGRSDRLFRRLVGPDATITRRPDGKPEAAGDRALTAAHAGDWTVAAAGVGVISCDLEPVASRPGAVWRDLLGPDRWELAARIARRTDEPLDQAATRLWVAAECLVKAGVSSGAPLVLDRADDGRAVVFRSGGLSILTLPLPDGRGPTSSPMMLGFLSGRPDARI